MSAITPDQAKAFRAAIAEQVRRNCTPSSEAYAAGGDALIRAVADWIENPPGWSALPGGFIGVEEPQGDQKQPDRIDAILMRVGVNMGDHAETMWRSVEVGEDETVRDLMERLLPEGERGRPRDYDSWVRLSFVEPQGQAVAP